MTVFVKSVTSPPRRLFHGWKPTKGTKVPSNFDSLEKWMSSNTTEKDASKIGCIGPLNLQEICRTGRVPEYFNFANDVFDWHAAQRPSDPALWFCDESNNNDRVWTFSEFKDESIKSALVLRQQLKEVKNPFVLVILPRIPEWWFLHMGTIRIGAIFCPGVKLLTPEDIQYRLEASSAQMIITDEEGVEKVEKAHQSLLNSSPNATKRLKKLLISNNSSAKEGSWINYNKQIKEMPESLVSKFQNVKTKSEEIAQSFFTSGTTGKPKMVAHTHTSYGIGHVETARQVGLKYSDLFWNISDPGWAKSSFSNFFAPWIAGSTVFIHQMKRFEAKTVLEVLRTKPVTTLCAPPTLFKAMIPEPDESFKFKALRYAFGAGEPLNPEVMRAWKIKTGNIPIDQMYGQTEFTVLGCQTDVENKEGSIGKSNGMYTAKVVDENGKEMPRNQEGILALQMKPVRPVGVFKGYLKQGSEGPVWDDEKNGQCFVEDVYLTGDKCIMDDDGYIFFIGRADDIITSSGYRIGPTEVESALQTHPAVVESAAVASPDKDRGEVVKAFIILNEKYKSADKKKLISELQSHVKSHTAPYKYPRKIEFVETLPKTVSGKILRRELKRQEYENWKS